MRLVAGGLAFVLVASAVRVGLAAPDPFSPASAAPPSFIGGYSSPQPSSSFVPRSPAMNVLGVALVVAGGLTLVSAPIVGASSTSPAGDPTKSSSTDGAVLGLFIGGVVLVAAGIPIAVYGSTNVAPAPPAKARLAPAPGGLRVVF